MSVMTDFAGRAARRVGLLAAAGVFLGLTLSVEASAETRTLKLYHVHTREKVEIAYKKNGRYIPDGLFKINRALRDWRTSEPVKMDPKLLDIIWETHRQSGSRDYIHVIGGYRSPGTNKMLRSRSSGVAKNSQHTQGRAMDFFIPGVPLKKLRDIGLRMQAGGVGYYPKSGSPFVHFDTGNVRHWPRLSRKELVAVFPQGGTIHVPSDGKPLPGYQQALAAYKQRGGAPAVQVAESSGGRGKTLLAAIFGGGSDEAEDAADVAAPVAPQPSRAAPQQPVRAAPEPRVQVAAVIPSPKPAGLAAGVPLPDRAAPAAASTPMPPTEIASPAEIAPRTEVAALEVARVPLPQPSPQRASETPAAEADTLVAAVQPAQADRVAPQQMAYAVPTPQNRPPFAAVLKDEQPAAQEADELKALIAAAADLSPGAAKAAPSPEAAVQRSETPKPAVPSSSNLMVAAVQPVERPQPAAASPQTREISEGKTGRFDKAPAASPPQARIVDPAEAIDSRIEVAALVAGPHRRAAEIGLERPKADVLVHDVPEAVFTAGFAPSAQQEASNRFVGSAVRFLPVAKFR